MRGSWPPAASTPATPRDYLDAGAAALGVGGSVTRPGGLQALLEVLRTG